MAKRQQGYLLTVKLFLPVDPKNIKDTRGKAEAIDAADETKSLDKLSAAGAEVLDLKHRYTSRPTPEEAAAETEDDTQEEGDGVNEEWPEHQAENVTESDEQAEPTAGRRRK